MIDYAPVALFLATGFVWIFTACQNAHLLRVFKEQLPEVARAEIPWIDSGWRHPKMIFFFYSQRAEVLLSGYQDLRRARRLFVVFSALSVLVPLGGIGALALYAAYETLR